MPPAQVPRPPISLADRRVGKNLLALLPVGVFSPLR
jgi:hypothetical protein